SNSALLSVSYALSLHDALPTYLPRDAPREGGRYEFGPFRLDAAERLLARGGQPVALTPKAFDLLVYLVERAGRLVEKRELMAALDRKSTRLNSSHEWSSYAVFC